MENNYLDQLEFAGYYNNPSFKGAVVANFVLQAVPPMMIFA
jgi:hypothetical protein